MNNDNVSFLVVINFPPDLGISELISLSLAHVRLAGKSGNGSDSFFVGKNSGSTRTAAPETLRRIVPSLVTAFIVAVMALVVYLLSATGAPVIRLDLSASWWTWPLQIATALAAVGAIVTLLRRQLRLARLFAALQVTLILWGWGNAQYPYLVIPDLTIQNSAAPAITLRLVLIALLAGVVLLFPSF